MVNDPAHTYYVEFRGKDCTLRNMEKRIVRKFFMSSDVVNAQVSGSGDNAIVAIVCKDGKTYTYRSDGRIFNG